MGGAMKGLLVWAANTSLLCLNKASNALAYCTNIKICQKLAQFFNSFLFVFEL